jgi:hypothetical protein
MGNDLRPEYQLIQYDDYWTIPLVGKPVCRFQVDFQLTLQFFEPEDEETTVWISGEFKLEMDGEEHSLSAENREKIGPVLSLFRKTVRARLTVAPHPNYESWGVTGVRWLRVVCMPGGNLAVWSADPPDANHIKH